MSHLKLPLIGSILASLVLCSGCACIQGPGYRLEDVSMQGSCEDVFAEGEYEYYGPNLPKIPVPGWVKKWHEDRKLPKPPQSPRFQPLPTRPMFSRQPEADGRAFSCFGQLP